MSELRLTEAAERFGGTLLNPDGCFDSISIDSRTVMPGDLFVAINGENFDAHRFIPDIAKKISGAVVSKPDPSLNIPQWVVEDTSVALGHLAKLRREKFVGQLIAITGSSGKTSVKESLISILAVTQFVHGTNGNLNNHLGVPLTLLSMRADIDIAVIEMGASAAGEIDYLCSVAKPDVALINNAQAAHIEGFGSVEAIAKAKAEIYSGLESDGIAILNADEIWSKGWSDIIGDRSCLRFSVEDDSADIFAKEISEAGSGCYSFILCLHPRLGSISGEQFLKLTMPGLHAVSNALAAAACAVAVGSSLSSIITGLSTVRSVPGRLQRFKLEDSYTVIDDSYNANPNSFETAIDVLCCCDGHRIVVMGDMGELGNYAEEAHQNIGRYAKNLGIDSFLGVGALSKIATDAFGGDHFQNQDQLLDAIAQKIDLLNIPATEVTILVKGSRSSHMEGIAQALINQESMPC